MFILFRAIVVILTILASAILTASFSQKHNQREWKYLSLLLWITFTVETIALLCNIWFGNNLIVYTIGQPLIAASTFLYFNYSNPMLKKRNIGIGVAMLVILANIIMHLTGWISWKNNNTEYLLLETILEIILGFAYFYYLLKCDEYIPLKEDPNFWIAVLVVMVNGGSFFQWIITEFIRVSPGSKNTLTKVYSVIAVLAMGYYLGFCGIFYYFKNKKLIHER